MGRRLDLKVGFSCNNNCIFCAQAHKRKLGDQKTEELKKHLEKAIENDGCDEVVFTGGEPTIRKDLPELISYARDLGYELVQIQSNGRRFFYKNFTMKLIKAGVTEFSPALHGHCAEIHESQTRAQGSFEQTTKGIKNLRELDQYILTNSVITKFNYKFLPKLAELLIQYEVNQFQFAFVHPCGNAGKNFLVVVPKKSKIVPYVHAALDKATEAGYEPGKVMVEAFPFCFMEGYEKFCSEFYIPPAEVRDSEMNIKKFEKWRVAKGKVKFSFCKKCKFDSICEGPWKEYPERFGNKEFKPVKGKKIESSTEILGKQDGEKFRRVDLLDV
jgi:MoaA/NifB/PqqE/SkfB family radical SAM enzyme